MKARILCLPGAGVGPDLLAEVQRVLAAVAAVRGHEFAFVPPPDPSPVSLASTEMAAACRICDAILLGAAPAPADPLAAALRALCRRLDLHTVLHPVRSGLAAPGRGAAPPPGGDLLLVRDLAALDEAPRPGPRPVAPVDLTPVVRAGLRAATRRRGRLTAVDPEPGPGRPSRVAWRDLVARLARSYPDVDVEYVSEAVVRARLGQEGPRRLDVVVACGPDHRLLQEALGRVVGSPGLLPAAAVGETTLGLYAPAHGPVMRLAGRDRANPVGALLAAVMLLRRSLELMREANLLEGAVVTTLRQGRLTADLARDPRDRVGTRELVDGVLRQLERSAAGAAG
jgi:3-isopropylmalate dehydrogenase